MAVLFAGFALTVAGAAAAEATSREIGHGVRLRGSSVWFAHGKAIRPKSISAMVVPSPAQPVKVQWAVACQKPNAADPAFHLNALSKSGQVTVPAAATVKLALPYQNPHTCVATVYATLAKTGRLTLRLLES